MSDTDRAVGGHRSCRGFARLQWVGGMRTASSERSAVLPKVNVSYLDESERSVFRHGALAGVLKDGLTGSAVFFPPFFLLSPFFPASSTTDTSSHRGSLKTKRAASFENRPDERRSGTTRNRTGDTRIFSPLLYQLSYGTIIFCNYHRVFSTISELRCKGSILILPCQIICKIFHIVCTH